MKNRESFVKAMFFFLSILLVGGIVALIFSFRLEQMEKRVSVGAVFIGVSNDKGWNESHFKGIESACKLHSCDMYSSMSVPDDQIEPLMRAVAELVGKGCSCIFLTSYGYGNFADKVAGMYPNVAFFTISGDVAADNCMSYFARMYQVRYLAGIAAGAATRSNLLGYVTAIPVPETVRSVNAYILGARKVNPKARLLVKFVGSWNDQEAEEETVRAMIRRGVDVLTSHQDRSYALDLADEMGIFTTGYDYVSREYSEKFLTAAVFSWDMIYKKVLSDYLSGRSNFSNSYWLGLSDKAVSLYPYSNLVKEETRELIAMEEARIKTWRDVFSGVIYDTEGNLRCNDNERIGDDELFNRIDWYVEGVEICE